MVRVVYVLIAFMVLLASCAGGSVEPMLKQDARVQSFLQVYPDALYEQAFFTEHNTVGLLDLFHAECPGIEPPFTRGVYTQYGAQLVAYVHDGPNGSSIQCVLSKLDVGQANIVQGDPANAPEGVALTVNGQPIMMDRVQAVFATLPQEQQTLTNVNTILDQLVSDELIRQEAAKYDVSDDVEKAYASLVNQSGLDETAFTNALVEQGTSPEAVKEYLASQIQRQQLLNNKLHLDEITVDDAQARKFYQANTETFIVSEQSTFQQIFISTLDRTPEDAVTRGNQVSQLLQLQDFCTVVKRYSDDIDSVDRCGIYTIPRGVVAQQIETAAFDAPINQTVVVQTENGLHIIRVLARQPSQQIPFEQVQEQAKGLMQNQIAQLRINAYLGSLRKDADVVVYLQLVDNSATGDADA